MNHRGGGKRNKLGQGPRPPKAAGHHIRREKIQNPLSGNADHVNHPEDGSGRPVGRAAEIRIEDKCQKEAGIEVPTDKQNVQEDVALKERESTTVHSSCTNSECMKEKARYQELLKDHEERIRQLEEKIEQLTSKDYHQNNAAKKILNVDISTKHTAAPVNAVEQVKRTSFSEIPEKKNKLCKKEAENDEISKRDSSLEQAAPKSWADDSIAEEEKHMKLNKAAQGAGIQEESCSYSVDYPTQDDGACGYQADWPQYNTGSSQQNESWIDEAENKMSNILLMQQGTNCHNATMNLPPTDTIYDQPEQNRNEKAQNTYGARQQGRRNWSNREVRPQDTYQERGARSYQKQHFNHRQQQHKPTDWTSHQGERPVKWKRVVNEIEGDLFTAPNTFSLTHCVAEDMRMGSGIAVTFRQMFKRVDELLAQGARTGEVAVLEDKGRFIYYLVTKKLSTDKPYLEHLRSSLIKMREHMLTNNVHDVAMPRIGCGLDKLQWQDVKGSLIEIFREDDVNITVYNFNQEQGGRNQPRSSLRIKHVDYTLANIENGTGLLYLGSEDGGISESLQNLLPKFPVLQEYKQSKRHLGHFVRTECKKEVLYGLIVKEKVDDKFSFTAFSQCLEHLRSVIWKDKYEYVGIDVVSIGDDLELATEKLITIFKNAWFKSDWYLYICWPKEYRSIYRERYKEPQKYMKQ